MDELEKTLTRILEKQSFPWWTSVLNLISGLIGAVVGGLIAALSATKTTDRVLSAQAAHEARRRETKLRVSWTFVNGPEGNFVTIEAVNESDFPVRVTWAEFFLQDRGGEIGWGPREFESDMEVIQTKDSWRMRIDMHYLERHGLDIHKPVTAYVETSTGQRFRSAEHAVVDARPR